MKTSLMLQKEREYGQPIEDILRGLAAQGMSRREMAAALGINYWTLLDWFRPDRLNASFETTIRFASDESAAVSSL